MELMSIGRLVLLLPLAGCALSSTDAQAQPTDPCTLLNEEWQTYVVLEEGDPARTAEELIAEFGSREAVAATLIELLRIRLDVEELTQLIREMNANPAQLEYTYEVPASLKGQSGFSTRLALTELLVGPQKLRGKIRDYVFEEDRLSGHMSVDMCIDDEHFYHWDIEVERDYAIHEWDETSETFPSMPDFAVPDDVKTRIADKGLTHKLHARGRVIRVDDIYYMHVGSTGLSRLDPAVSTLYDRTDESCVDLITKGQPPATYGQLVDAGYCLGRCEHPLFYNTGG